jgi:stage II sporulation protein AA (anti-sigma F factor antagonist)
VDVARIAVRDDDPSEAIVTVVGEIDLATRDQLCVSLHTATAVPGVKKIVVDLTQTRFMDASAIRSLVHGHQAARAAGIAYHIAGANGPVRRVLEITGALDLLQGDTPSQGLCA